MYNADIVANAARLAYNDHWKKAYPDNQIFNFPDLSWDDLDETARECWRRVAHTVIRSMPYEVDLGGGY